MESFKSNLSALSQVGDWHFTDLFIVTFDNFSDVSHSLFNNSGPVQVSRCVPTFTDRKNGKFTDFIVIINNGTGFEH